jgi:predicted transcriptional regulator
MATVNFSVPDAIKRRFNLTFKGRNKSAVLSQLMEEAVAQEESRKRRAKAVDALLALRATARPASANEVRKARQAGRP